MSNIPYQKKQLSEVRQEICKVMEKLGMLRAMEKSYFEGIQEDCSHPEEFMEQKLTNEDRDPGEAPHYVETCLACEKKLREYSIVRGNEYGVKTF